ncbi:MAG TPA: dephospho-CoA kinase [Saprospiraceae bacterium]|nr:dephospho-CoA kinase [Saprospiraceae bacterium]HMQ83375.1 dephospho-CoA kinase [Saprospiraceae bacterium]
MLKIGITGGIGSGKTTVCKIFETLGIPVYYADEQARRLMVEDPTLVQNIRQLLGEGAYTESGQLNRAYIAQQVFQDKSLLQQLNQLVHPAVALDGLHWHESQTGVPYTLKEAALLIESGSYKQLDYLIVVTAPEAIRLERVMQRDQVESAAVLARMKQQLPESEKIALADFLIDNNGQHPLIPQVLTIHQQLLAF